MFAEQAIPDKRSLPNLFKGKLMNPFRYSSRIVTGFSMLLATVLIFGCDQNSSKDVGGDAGGETAAASGDGSEVVKREESAAERSLAAMANGEVKDIRKLMDLGERFYAAGDMERSVQAYDLVLEANPSLKPRLWQRGLALYYNEEYLRGVDQFESHQTLNTQDVENSVWHLLCQAKLTSVDEARQSMIQINGDFRVPMKQVFQLFAGTATPEDVLKASGYKQGSLRQSSELYHGLIYVGLYYEMMGDQDASIDAMEQAVECLPPMVGLMSHVADTHLKLRKPQSNEAD